MQKLFKHFLFILLAYSCICLPISAEDISDQQSFSVTIPKAIHVNGIGLSPQNQYHGVPAEGSTTFDLEVTESEYENSWELTTVHPVGVSISYNVSGSILAVFATMTRLGDGFVIPDSDISIYPSKVVFATGPDGGGDAQRIFHFHPKIRVSKSTPPGNYIANITFTVLSQ